MLILKKITKINNLGIFNGFVWPTGLSEFKQYNVIYGWNGTGKTTLSKLFSSLNQGHNPEFPSLEYTVSDSEGNSHSQGSSFTTPIRVFNRDFINDNVDFETQVSKVITVILGEENKEIIQAIDEDETKLGEVKTEITTKKIEKKSQEEIKNNIFTNIAKIIGQSTQGAIVRNYDRTNAKNAFNDLTKKELLSEEDLATLCQSVSQDVMNKQNLLSVGVTATNMEGAVEKAKNLLSKTVEATIVQRLKDNPDISSWVEEGLSIHNNHGSDHCEFCGNVINADRITDLTAHFNEADAKLKSEIDDLISSLRSIYSTIQRLQPVDKMYLYSEYRDKYSTKIDTLSREQNAVLAVIESLAEQLKDKKNHTTDQVDLTEAPNLTNLETIVEEVNLILSEHNKKTDDFETKREGDCKKIEIHHLSTIYDEVKNIEAEIEALDKKIEELTDGVDGDEKKIGKNKLIARIAKNKARVSSSHKACGILNDSLRKFLGHGEVSFSVNADGSGYQIMRGNQPARSLSEGERTAIAFIYFITQLTDENFDSRNGIIIVDDPISSLDANSQFQAFSFLKTATGNAAQLFLFTHNFDFLKLLLGWIKNSRKGYALFMIKNIFSITDGSRFAQLDKLDTSLEKFESEYHYLFNVLYAYKDDGTISNAYNMPNIARKLLDNFLMFYIPKNENTYNRLQELSFDEQKKAAIYKFVNNESHITGSGFDPALVPETQKCVGYLLELIETVLPSHFNYLKDSVTQ